MKYHIVNSLPESEWRCFVEQHPEGNIFHTPDMFHVFQQVKDYHPELWAALGDDGRILALFIPVHITLKNGIMKKITTRTNVFGGVLVSNESEAVQALTELLHAYQKSSGNNSLFTEIRNISPTDRFQDILCQYGFKYEEQLNYLIDLTPSPDEVFKRIGQRTRKNIRREMNLSRIQIIQASEQKEIMESYDLLINSYRHAQVPLSDKSLFLTAYTELAPKGMITVLIALVDQIPAATSIELFFKDTVTGWFAGMDRSLGSHCANEILMWHVLKNSSEMGYKKYDFGGAGRSDQKYGVRDFKAKFGGTLVDYGRNTWVPKPFILEMGKLGYRLYRRFYGLGRL